MSTQPPEAPRIRPVILAGGAGTRLWPMSTAGRPKQLLPLTSDKTLFEETLDRFADHERFAEPIVVTSIEHAKAIETLLGRASTATLLLEPVKRNTAPAIALAAHAAAADDLLLVLPSDHYIAETERFLTAVERGRAAAADGQIVTFGVTPTRPDTGYGYIAVGKDRGDGSHLVERFVEKPGEEEARRLVERGDHLWNAGIFLARASTFREELTAFDPAIAQAAEAAIAECRREGSWVHPGDTAFARSPAQSIDYAVLEHSQRVAVVPADMHWSDIGGWLSLYEAAAKDGQGNAVASGARAWDCSGTMVRTSGPKVAAIGLTDLVVVATPDAVLVARVSESDRVRDAAAWFEEELASGGEA